eukprot:2205322-Rhodomonas_salina.1
MRLFTSMRHDNCNIDRHMRTDTRTHARARTHTHTCVCTPHRVLCSHTHPRSPRRGRKREREQASDTRDEERAGNAPTVFSPALRAPARPDAHCVCASVRLAKANRSADIMPKCTLNQRRTTHVEQQCTGIAQHARRQSVVRVMSIPDIA